MIEEKNMEKFCAEFPEEDARYFQECASCGEIFNLDFMDDGDCPDCSERKEKDIIVEAIFDYLRENDLGIQFSHPRDFANEFNAWPASHADESDDPYFPKNSSDLRIQIERILDGGGNAATQAYGGWGYYESEEFDEETRGHLFEIKELIEKIRN